MSLKLLHISDIHFKCHKDNTYLDLDKNIQNEIEFDLKELHNKVGAVDAILIGGDIAFSGQDEQYAIADEWIKKICNLIGCSQENVLTVPGNHDVDRTKICPMLKDVHTSFKKLKQRNDIDTKLASYLTNDSSSVSLLKTFDNYSSFAQKYGSIPKKGNLLYWEKDFSIGNDILRIRGVNSAIVSNEMDDENLSKLILGSHQSQFIRGEGVINLILCHHPPQWLTDGENVNRDLLARASILLYGHKHAIDVTKVNETLVLSAGAMQPSRNELGWDPRYNLIELETEQNNTHKLLHVKIWKRVWDQKKSQKFIPDYGPGGSEFEEHRLQYEVLAKTQITVPKERLPQAEKIDNEIELIDISTPNPMRKLTYMFLSLPYHKKLTVAVKLELIEDSDKDLTEAQRYQSYFRRAEERGILSSLWDLTVSMLSEKPETENPFK